MGIDSACSKFRSLENSIRARRLNSCARAMVWREWGTSSIHTVMDVVCIRVMTKGECWMTVKGEFSHKRRVFVLRKRKPFRICFICISDSRIILRLPYSSHSPPPPSPPIPLTIHLYVWGVCVCATVIYNKVYGTVCSAYTQIHSVV